MEDKLYFKPEPSGKKKTANKNVEKTEKKKDHRFLKLFFFLLFILIIILIIIWLLRGTKTVSGRYPENIKNESLECVAKDITYEKANKVDSENKELKIGMIFYDNREFNSASLEYTLHFLDRSESVRAEALLHAQFAKNLAASGYDFGKFDNKFSIIDGDLVISLHASDGKIDEVSKDYFLVKETKTERMPITLEEYRINYETQGFTCESSLDNK